MFRTLDEADVRGKRVLVRVDLNVPVENGKVADTTRIERVAPTIREIADKGGKVILLSHFGRPKGGDPAQSLKPFAPAIAAVLERPVAFAEDCIGERAAAAVNAMKPGDILCLENTRFHPGEERNDPGFVAALAALGDIFVNDAFSVAAVSFDSIEGLGHRLPRYRPSSTCSAACSRRSTRSSSAAVWPIPFWPRADIPWANRCASTISCRPRARSWPRRRPKAASWYCRWTPWLPKRSRPTRLRAWSRWTGWATMR